MCWLRNNRVVTTDRPSCQVSFLKAHRENKTGTQEAYHPHNYVYGPRVKNTIQPNAEEWDPTRPSPFKEAEVK